MSSLPLARYYRPMFIVGAMLLIIPGGVLGYLISPFPDSQERESLALAYYLDKFLPYLLILGALLVIGQIIHVLRTKPLRGRMGMIFFCVFLLGFNFLVNIQMKAPMIFKEMDTKTLADAKANKVPLDWLIMGVEHGGQAAAYPVNLIAYHHRLEDTVGGMPVLVTYCSLCRTGLAFSPILDGVHQEFRLVGVQHYNAMLQDRETGTWWYQATGEAAYGPLKGKHLQEVPTQQMTLRAWLALYPASRVLQPDPKFSSFYTKYDGFDTTAAYEKDSSGRALRWVRGSWVAGVETGGSARAYEWSDLEKHRVINDELGTTPVVLALDKSLYGVFAFKRTVDGAALSFAPDSSGRGLRDASTHSLWDWTGRCMEGAMAGKQLEPLTVRPFYWHAWRTFHPTTTQWKEQA